MDAQSCITGNNGWEETGRPLLGQGLLHDIQFYDWHVILMLRGDRLSMLSWIHLTPSPKAAAAAALVNDADRYFRPDRGGTDDGHYSQGTCGP